ncbi:FtsW/RodA/SpoVE family cell cycle protein [Helicobacter sp. 11S02596-1]|uniref:FtsW/RodA/SpoVE family cell cycle protein n=1 Tax=Helicobacter sp. 11S02596-1 TaxID=1476194 RepID=UPI000BA5B3A9|nr:FtsW/RodA/SpoVE family cell cycle protein [Helicobacter sp. 11S02596-1]
MMIDRRILTHFDFLLLFLILPIIAMSFFLINEASESLSIKQGIYITAGFFLFWIIFFIPFRSLSKSISIFYWFCILLLLFVDVYGTMKLGAQRWIVIPGIGASLQPSEPVKVAILLMLANIIAHNPPPRNGYGWKDFLKISFYIILPFLLILKQPDLGTALVVLIMGFGILFLIGVNYKIWLSIFLVVSIASPLIYHSLHDYQRKRIHDFIAEKPSYHVRQSVITIGSGGLLGKSKENSTQTQLKFLPIATSDFIFAYYVERFGFVGAFILLAIYVGLILHILSFCFIDSRDYRLRVMASGVALLIFVYMGVNVAMTIGLAPVVGVPLPMFSYGGSSFITFIVLLGILENLLAFRFNFEYNSSPFRNMNKKGPLAQLVRALGS